MTYLYKGVSIRDQAGTVLACARLERANPVTASYVNGITFSESLPFAPVVVSGGNSTSLVYPILTEIGTSTNTCIDDSSIFNPWGAVAQCDGAVAQCDSAVTLDQCPLGDLIGHGMDVQVGMTTLHSPLTGRASIVGHTVSLVEGSIISLCMGLGYRIHFSFLVVNHYSIDKTT